MGYLVAIHQILLQVIVVSIHYQCLLSISSQFSWSEYSLFFFAKMYLSLSALLVDAPPLDILTPFIPDIKAVMERERGFVSKVTQIRAATAPYLPH